MSILMLIPLLLRLGTTAPEAPPATDPITIGIIANTISPKGGERANVGFRTGDQLAIGVTTRAAMSAMPGVCVFSVRPANNIRMLDDGAVGGWTVAVTPVSVIDRAVTFRVAWMRYGDDGKTTVAEGDQQVTLLPGESLPLDIVPISGRMRQVLNGGCTATAASLRVNVEYGVRPDLDRRLLETDVWLVEHLPDGKEKSQHTTVRGQFNTPTSFYFDDVPMLKGAFDISGVFTARQVDGAIALDIETIRRSANNVPVGRAHSDLQLKPGDVASVTLPAIVVQNWVWGSLTDDVEARLRSLGYVQKDASTGAQRNFSLTIRTKEIR